VEFWQASGETSGAIQVRFQGCPSLRVCWFNLVQAISSCVRAVTKYRVIEFLRFSFCIVICHCLFIELAVDYDCHVQMLCGTICQVI
jgi:hypothetical protein